MSFEKSKSLIATKLGWWIKHGNLYEINSHFESCYPNRCGIRSDVGMHHLQTVKAGNDSSAGTVMHFASSFTNSSNVVPLFHLWSHVKSILAQFPCWSWENKTSVNLSCLLLFCCFISFSTGLIRIACFQEEHVTYPRWNPMATMLRMQMRCSRT